MGTAEKNLYKEYKNRLKEKGIKQLTNEEMEKEREMTSDDINFC